MEDCKSCEDCICRHVCGSNISLYSDKCMQSMKDFDAKGLSGSGNKLEELKSGRGESLSQFRKWLEHKREINSMYAHGMDINVLEEIWLFAQNNIGNQKCKSCNLDATNHYCNVHKPWSPT